MTLLSRRRPVSQIADAMQNLMATSRDVTHAMEQINTMADEITTATDRHNASTSQINEAVSCIHNLASEIQRVTVHQSNSLHQMVQQTEDIVELIGQNLLSSQQISHTTEELALQADILVKSVERFTF